MENNLQKNKTKSLCCDCILEMHLFCCILEMHLFCCIFEMQHGKLTMLQLKNKILIRNNFGEKSQRSNQKVISN